MAFFFDDETGEVGGILERFAGDESDIASCVSELLSSDEVLQELKSTNCNTAESRI